ncbi:serine/threonine-protein kinase [Glycomyces artemisiae]|uniref:non-specific serine/threonine protein kinase n=1 Tax=Glycomyces artemisiae TaxID=1076443 RepID=A0A2T0UP20_9ACTN|nr:serine/threonine-protein kinase [Glycomyces artemisiae]PRY59654.1 serine/threonine protein kinase [Glycomyces artemisiae]
MDETSDPFAPVRRRLGELLPEYRLAADPPSTTGLSQVFRAEDLRLHHRRVAVKAMAGYLSMHPGYRQRFLREIQLMTELEHPNIMYLIRASAAEDDLLYLVMPWAEDDLRRRLARERLDLAAAVDVVMQVARALDYAHDRGVVHRDVKPANILFGAEGHVYLSDFGVAKDRMGPDLTVAGESIGTRRYTAPEVYSAGPADPNAPGVPAERPATDAERAGDVYSLGAVLYHCLNGQRPFDHLDDSAAELAQREGDLTPVTMLHPQLPAALDPVVAKAMHVDPAQRYRSCGELARALAQTVGVTDAGSALPILRDIQERLRTEPGERTELVRSVPAARPHWLHLLVPVLSLLLAAGVLAWSAFGPEDDGGGSGVAAEETSGEEVEEGAEPTAPPPVTGDEQVERRPLVGECTTDDDETWVVVACDSPDAAEYYYRIVVNPEDPNPSQPDHDDASWLACGDSRATDFEYYWSDSTPDGEQWDPATDVIYYIMCYQEL